jgi:hypothetical protein
MTSNATPVASLERHKLPEWPELQPQFRPAVPQWRETRLIGIEPNHTSQIGVLELIFNAWHAIGVNATPIATTGYSDLLEGFSPALIRTTDVGRRYMNAAAELKSLLAPALTIASIASLCGVSERGFYNWLDGGGIRERRSRRLLEVRSLARALTLRLGRDGATTWLQRPHPDLGFEAPMEVIQRDDIKRVLPLVVGTRRTAQPHSLIPIVEDVSNEIDATEVLNEQGRLDPEVYDLL